MELDNILPSISFYFNKILECIHWLPEILTIVAIALIIDFIFKRFALRLERLFSVDKNAFVNALAYGIYSPGRVFIWFYALTFSAILIYSKVTDNSIADIVATFRNIATVLLLNWSLMRLVQRSEENFIKPRGRKKPVNKTTAIAVSRILRVVIIVFTVLLVLSSLNINITGLVAFGSAGTIVAGLAAKDLLSNFFGGFMIFFDRPFFVGDWVRSPDKNIEGHVEHIGWRITKIRTLEKRPLYVPNSVFLTISIENPSRMSNRRLRETIGLRYDDANLLPKILAEVEEMLNAHPDLDHNMNNYIAFTSFGPSSLDCLLNCFSIETKWVPFLKIKQDILLKVQDIIHKYGADIAFPTSIVKLEKE